MGHAARGLFNMPELTEMAERRRFSLLDTTMLGGDLRLRLRPV
jgi:riboflavin biosynthesis pyrimidine reductase